MKIKLKSIIALFFAAFIIVACKSTTTGTQTAKVAVKEDRLANSLLWKISGNGLEKPSYVFGTIHLTCNYELSEQLEAAFAKTDQLVLEVDMDDPQMQMKVMKTMMMTEGKTIKSILTEEEYNTLSNFFKESTGLSLDLFNTMKPFSLLSMLVLKSVDCETPQSYENEFVKIAKSQNEEVLGLETIESQMAIFDSIPYKDQLKDLLSMAEKGLESSKSEFDQLSVMHKNQDLEGMLKLSLETEGMTKEFSNIIIDNRNKNWIPVMEKMAKEKATFFGVGALHLPGENGVLKLLRKAGYEVLPVN